MPETLFEELKRYVKFGPVDEAALRAVHLVVEPQFERVAHVFYERILEHDAARKVLEGGESSVGRLRVTLVQWMDRMLRGPWDEDYFEARCRIGRVHVRINLPQHYMLGAMDVVRVELQRIVALHFHGDPERTAATIEAVAKILDLELAIMLHTYREDLLAQNEKAARLSTFGQLVASIGHDLRNPLGVMESSLYILRGRIGDDERALKHVDRIGSQVRIANGIITNLLDMIRNQPVASERTALPDVLASALAQLGPLDGVRVVVGGAVPATVVDGDPGQLRQVLVNLLDNAVYAAGVGGEVRVDFSTEGGHVEVAVEDSGAGVSPEIRHRLFEPLVTDKSKGIGLGLALVKRIVERHRGTIAYDPRPGRGARFVVRLPRSASA